MALTRDQRPNFLARTLESDHIDLPRFEFEARCQSYKCTKKPISSGIIKNVSRGTITCPECGSALKWVKRVRVEVRVQEFA